jgi:hypothetical protein
MPAPVGFRVLAARLLRPEPVLLGHQLFDRVMDLASVDVTSFGPKTSPADDKQRGPRPSSDRIAAGWEARDAAVRRTIEYLDASTRRVPFAARWTTRME